MSDSRISKIDEAEAAPTLELLMGMGAEYEHLVSATPAWTSTTSPTATGTTSDTSTPGRVEESR